MLLLIYVLNFENKILIFVLLYSFSAETNELYDTLEKGGSAARNALRDDEIVEENTGFAIVINGHSLVHCLSPELESR